MFEWISQNIGTIVAALLVAAAAAGAVILLVREKKKGKHSCGCGCANCPMAGKCHQKKGGC
jgi:hypothetical protein